MQRWRSTWVAVLAALAMVATGCGDGDGDDGGAATPAGSPAGTASAPAPPDDGGATPTAAEGSAGGGDAASFANLAQAGFEANARVTYRVTSDGSEQTMTFSSDGQQSAVFYPGGRVIARADGSAVVCSESGSAQCFEFADIAGGAQGFVGAFAAPFVGLAAAFESGVTTIPGYSSAGERTIAGRSAQCSTFDPSDFLAGSQSTGEATFCIDLDAGIALLYEVSSPEGSWSMEATEIGEPQASDFEPPAEPQVAPVG